MWSPNRYPQNVSFEVNGAYGLGSQISELSLYEC